MNLEALIATAKELGASDLHLEGGLPGSVRVRGLLRPLGDPIPAKILSEWARQIIGESNWPQFLERRSFDLSKTIQGMRCRINVLQTARGVGFAIRLLTAFQATIEKLNLHPDLKKLVSQNNGLILVSGPTGSGKSSTLAALIQEINVSEPRHIVTIESPIEYTLRPQRSFIRQREVGRDTPSFEQALLDALREDPDVLMVGELRDSETMRLTLNASETGHLVLATLHSSTCAEALQRVISAFPAEIQNSVAAQLADCLVGVIAQRLRFRADLNIRVPECEILLPTIPVKNFIRNREFFKIVSTMETGAEHGMWTFQRYRTWMEKRTNWYLPGRNPEVVDSEPPNADSAGAHLPALTLSPTAPKAVGEEKLEVAKQSSAQTPGGRIEIEPVEGGLDELLKKLE